MGRPTKITKAFVAKYSSEIRYVLNNKNNGSVGRTTKAYVIDCARNELGFSKATGETQIWQKIVKEWIRL